MAQISLSIVMAVWVAAIAILSVQNATPVSIQFLGFRSIELPFGVVLGFFSGGAMVITMALVQWWSRSHRPSQKRP